MSTKWIERKSPLGAVSDIPPSLPSHGLRVKSSSSSHKLAGRFISSLTFSLEMPLGTWASALWREMTGLLLGAAVVKSYSHTHSSFFFLLSPFHSFPSPYEAFQHAMTATLKAKAHICLVHLINFNITPLHHIQNPLRQSSKITGGR